MRLRQRDRRHARPPTDRRPAPGRARGDGLKQAPPVRVACSRHRSALAAYPLNKRAISLLSVAAGSGQTGEMARVGISRRKHTQHRGVSEKAVRKAIAAGRIRVETDGSIDPAKADVDWAQTDPAMQRGAQSHRHGALDVPGGVSGPAHGPSQRRRADPVGHHRPRHGRDVPSAQGPARMTDEL